MPKFKKSLKATTKNLKKCGKIAIYPILILREGVNDSDLRVDRAHVAETVLFSGLTLTSGIVATATLGVTVPLGLVGGAACVLAGTVHAAYSGTLDLINYVVRDRNRNQDPAQDLEQEQDNMLVRYSSSHHMMAENLQDTNEVAIEDFTSDMQDYFYGYQFEEFNMDKLLRLKLTYEEEKPLKQFIDPVTKDVIDVPVKLNGRTYDIATIVEALETDQLDPIQGSPFMATDVVPNRHMALQLDEIIFGLEIMKRQQIFVEKKQQKILDDMMLGDTSVDKAEMCIQQSNMI